VLDGLRGSRPDIDRRVMQAGNGDPDLALRNDPSLEAEVDAELFQRKHTADVAKAGLGTDVITKRILNSARAALTRVEQNYGPSIDPKSGQPFINPETNQPYTYRDVLTRSKFLGTVGSYLPEGANVQIRMIMNDPNAPEGLRLAARHVVESATIRPSLAKAMGEVGNLNTMEQTVFDSYIINGNESVVSAEGKEATLRTMLQGTIDTLSSGKADPMAVINDFRRKLGLPPRDHFYSQKELNDLDRAQGFQGPLPPDEETGRAAEEAGRVE